MQTQSNSPPPSTLRRAVRRGMTLVEVMFAAGILALVFVSAMFGLQGGYQMADNARNSTIAAQVMQSEMENLRLMNWAQLSALPASETITIDTTFVTIASNFTCVRTISDITTGLKSVTLTVTWNSYDGRTHRRSFFTYFSEGGLNDYYYRAL